MNKTLVQMTSGGLGKNCRHFSHGSIKTVKWDSNGVFWETDCVDSPIPPNYPFKYLDGEVTDTKKCDYCLQLFSSHWPFINGICTSCYAAKNILGHHNLYKEAIRQELLIELREQDLLK